MKKMRSTLGLMAVSAVLFSFTSCRREFCDPFHEGQNCELEIRQRHYGQYKGILIVNGSAKTETVPVMSWPDGPRFIAVNYLRAYLTSPNTFDIVHQYINIQAMGSGSFNGPKLQFVYELPDAGMLIRFSGTRLP